MTSHTPFSVHQLTYSIVLAARTQVLVKHGLWQVLSGYSHLQTTVRSLLH